VKSIPRNAVAVAICLAASAALCLLPACKKGSPNIAVQSTDAVLSPIMIGVGSVFMEIVNSGDAEDFLVNAATDIPGTIAELHDVQDGKMARVDRMRISPDNSLRLRPGGLHIMIFKLPKNVEEGHDFTLILDFSKSGRKAVPLKFTKTFLRRQ